MPKGLAAKLRAMEMGDSYVVASWRAMHNALSVARYCRIPVCTRKLIDGSGWEIIKLKWRPLHKCPKCGYVRYSSAAMNK